MEEEKKFTLRRKKVLLENRINRLKIDLILAESIKEEYEIENQIEMLQFELSHLEFQEV